MKQILAITFFLLSTPAMASDEEALLDLDQEYATHWKAGDADAVMGLFTADATLVPHHGDPVVKGHAAIRQFWFDPENPPTIVPYWERSAKEVLIIGDVGIVRGRAKITWEYADKRTTIPDNNYVLIAIRDGEDWKIRMLTWNDDPRLWIEEPLTKESASENNEKVLSLRPTNQQ